MLKSALVIIIVMSATGAIAQALDINRNPIDPSQRCRVFADGQTCVDRNRVTRDPIQSGEFFAGRETASALRLMELDPNDCRNYQGHIPPTRMVELVERFERCRSTH